MELLPFFCLDLLAMAMAQVVKERMIAFGQAGWADKVPNVTLEDMARRYR